MASGHLAHRHYDEDGEEGEGGLTTAKKRRRVTRVDRPRGVAAQFRQTDVSGVEEVYTCACTVGYMYMYMYTYVCIGYVFCACNCYIVYFRFHQFLLVKSFV